MRTFTMIAVLLASTSLTSVEAQNTYLLTASDFQFDPLVLNTNVGDTVRIALNPGHGFREVSQASWDLNVGNPGTGWDFSPSTQLEYHDLVTNVPGTIYYVCVPHVSMGMKGRIEVVQGTIGLEENHRPRFRIQPNPALGEVRIIDPPIGAVRARVLDATGRVCVDNALVLGGSVDLGSLTPGTYRLVVLDERGNLIGQEAVILLQH